MDIDPARTSPSDAVTRSQWPRRDRGAIQQVEPRDVVLRLGEWTVDQRDLAIADLHGRSHPPAGAAGCRRDARRVARRRPATPGCCSPRRETAGRWHLCRPGTGIPCDHLSRVALPTSGIATGGHFSRKLFHRTRPSSRARMVPMTHGRRFRLIRQLVGAFATCALTLAALTACSPTEKPVELSVKVYQLRSDYAIRGAQIEITNRSSHDVTITSATFGRRGSPRRSRRPRPRTRCRPRARPTSGSRWRPVAAMRRTPRRSSRCDIGVRMAQRARPPSPRASRSVRSRSFTGRTAPSRISRRSPRSRWRPRCASTRRPRRTANGPPCSI